MLIADLHIHSKYSRATSGQCTPEYLDLWGRRKGIHLLGTGDFTHPAWREELKEKLEPAEEGLYVLKAPYRIDDPVCGDSVPVRFVLSGEISSIYKKNGKVRKVHNVILLPSIESAGQLSKKLEEIGNVHSDGRPILGLDSKDLLEITLSVCPEAVFIPAHIWTPHFSLFGAFSGFDTIEECFEDLTPCIHALETGLSSDPPMNCRVSLLDRYHMVSNSDAHSPAKLGREANLFKTQLSYPALAAALADHTSDQFSGTIEFFPEEGKYHLDGHRNCNLSLTPEETARYGGICPVCGKKITIGVLHRVEQLADRAAGFVPENAKTFESLVPLAEVIAASMGFASSAGQKVQTRYEKMLRELGSEFYILRQAPLNEIEHAASFPIAEGVRRMRCGQIALTPGFDGAYGKIKLFDETELAAMTGQMSFFAFQQAEAAPKILPDPVVSKAFDRAADNAAAAGRNDVKGTLNLAQQAAVTACEKAVAVIAGPGTGKTKTLIARILYLITEKGVDPQHITAVTFTNKAAGEMRERLGRELGKRKAAKVHIGTFHSLCLRLLSARETLPAIIDTFEARWLASQLLKEQDAAMQPKAFLEAVSAIKNRQSVQAADEISPALFDAYNQLLAQNGVMDFDDVLCKGLDQAETTEIDGFLHLLVDEFQDINDLQYRLLLAWGKNSESMFFIGDPDQSIYGFRGSDAACFQRLEQDFPSLYKVCLEENYRSAPEVLDCALSLIGHNPGVPRVLHPNAPGGAPVRSLNADSDFAQAVYTANEINRMVGGIDMLLAHSKEAQNGNYDFSDIAVLYRTHRQAEMLEHCLKQEGVPYLVAGRDQVLSKPGVRGVLGFFRWVLNEEDRLSARTASRLLLGMDTPDARLQALRLRFASLLKSVPPRGLLEQFLAEVSPADYEGIEKLLAMAVCYQTMESLLNSLLFGKERDVERAGGGEYHASCVTLTTLHGAKGLEFPIVFLCGVQSGLLPLETQNRVADVEEERRLFYVGMTRAKEQLVLLHAGTASSFLNEIPRSCLQNGAASHQKNPSGGKQLSLFD